jgi:mannose-6-phosphate isomerase-like protein (cupin superfamily)
MSTPTYNINLDVKFDPLDLIDVTKLGAEHQPWFNQTLCKVNDSVVRLGVLEGEFHWHKHENEDEFFYVVSGRLVIDVPDGEIDLGPTQGVTIPRGLMHRPRALGKTIVLMVESDTIVPTGDDSV